MDPLAFKGNSDQIFRNHDNFFNKSQWIDGYVTLMDEISQGVSGKSGQRAERSSECRLDSWSKAAN